MKSKELSAYETPDGRLFTDETAADKHFDDLLGEELDGLTKLFNFNVTRIDIQRAIIPLINNPEKLKESINALHALLNFNE